MGTEHQKNTWKNNMKFLREGPETFMRETLVDAASQLERSIVSIGVDPEEFLNNCQRVFDFDLVPVGFKKCCLMMRGAGSEFSGGPSLKGRFVGFAFRVPGVGKIARIEVPDDGLPIFTVGITGSRIDRNHQRFVRQSFCRMVSAGRALDC